MTETTMNIPELDNSFIEQVIKAAKEHQPGGYEWQEEKRLSFAKGAEFGYSLASKALSDANKEITELKKQVEVLRRLSGRNPDSKYTYYKLELKNISEEWDETICESLDDVKKQLEYLDIHLDDDTETEPGEERKVIITGIAMTPLEFEAWYRDAYKIDV